MKDLHAEALAIAALRDKATPGQWEVWTRIRATSDFSYNRQSADSAFIAAQEVSK